MEQKAMRTAVDGLMAWCPAAECTETTSIDQWGGKAQAGTGTPGYGDRVATYFRPQAPSRLDFQRCLAEAPTKVRTLMAKLQVESAGEAKGLTEYEVMRVPYCGRKTVELLRAWLNECEARRWRPAGGTCEIPSVA